VKTDSTSEEEFEVLPSIAPCMDFSFPNSWAVWDGDFHGLVLSKDPASENFHFFREGHTVVGWPHGFVIEDGFPKHPHARLGIFDSVSKQESSGEGKRPVSKSMDARH
jgi:hypothetical protein